MRESIEDKSWMWFGHLGRILEEEQIKNVWVARRIGKHRKENRNKPTKLSWRFFNQGREKVELSQSNGKRSEDVENFHNQKI